MKTINPGFSLLLTGCLIAGMIFILPSKGRSQDTVTDKPHKVVTVKMNIDGEEESISIDTSFSIETELDLEHLEMYLNTIQKQMKQLEKVHSLIDLRFHDRDHRSPRVFTYGDVSVEVDDEMGYVWKKNPYARNHGYTWKSPDKARSYRAFGVRRGEKNETLADVLGDIPMDAVTKYDVKKTRNGRKYIIEVNDLYHP